MHHRKKIQRLREGACSQEPVQGWTHNFYRYPARFSPAFAAAAIAQFSKPFDLVLDPFVGGGTTAVEAIVSHRSIVAADINSLAVFIARVKTTPLSNEETADILAWADRTAPRLHYRGSIVDEDVTGDRRVTNLTLPQSRPIKKAIAIGLATLSELQTDASRSLARCVLLRTSQWALDNRKRKTPLSEYRQRFRDNAAEMVAAIRELSERITLGSSNATCCLVQADATELASQPFFRTLKRPIDLVVASPPYPGIHVLYDRWQVDGRRETPAPYWIANCQDGRGTSHYTFGDRRRVNLDYYFATLRRSLTAIRSLMKDGGYMVQMVSFSDRQRQLRRYLSAMRATGFEEVSGSGDRQSRIWRNVPNRKWHANFKGRTNGSREVVLVLK